MNLPAIPSDIPGSSSWFKGVAKSGKKWMASIRIPSEGGSVYLGTFDSEEEAGIMYARARYKYPAQEPKKKRRRVKAITLHANLQLG